MSDTLTIITNRVPRLVLDWDQLTPAEQRDFDYLSEEDTIGRDFIRYRGQAYDLHDFQRVGSVVTPQMQEAGFPAWDGYRSDSFFSGVLVRYVDSDHVIMARYYS